MIRPPVPRVPDAELLARFVRHRDEAAFELLVWRYHRLVAGVCRRTAGDHHAAEDAAQAAFLLLARRAERVREAAALPGWLARVAYRCAVRARRQASGRCKPADPATDRNSPVAGGWVGRLTPAARQNLTDDADSLELFAALDAELDRLPDRLRLPVVLVHLDGRTYADAADALGIPVGTLSGRLRHARALLKDRLTRRGLAPLAVTTAVVADPMRVAAVTRAAIAFAAGDPSPDRPAALALGVLRAMTLPKLVVAGGLAGLVVAVAAVGLAGGQPPSPAGTSPAARPVASNFDRLQGEWLFDAAADENGNDAIQQYWNARLTFRKNTVAISGSPYSEAAIETTFTLDPAATPKRMDWAVPPFYQTLLKLPAGTVHGIYKLEDDDSLTVCMANRPGAGPRTGPLLKGSNGEKPTAPVIPFGPRPTEFKADVAKGHFLFTVRRWTGEPGKKLTDGTVTVLDTDGKPAAGATVGGVSQRWHDDTVKQQKPITAGADGVARFPAEHGPGTLTARLPDRKLIGYADATPAGFHRGLTIRLVPQATITGRLATDPPPAAGDIGWTNVYLKRPGPTGRTLAGYADRNGRFEFVAPPGEYELNAYGEVFDKKTVPLVVPTGVPAVDAGTVTGGLTRWGVVVGKPNPGLPGVARWVGTPSPPDALTGKVVLLYFPNVGTRDPKEWKREAVVAAHDKYAAQGLAVVGVYGDATGETLNAAAAMIELLKLPFPVALATGIADDWGMHLAAPGRTRTAAAYGAEPYPHAVLIDRHGVVRGRWFPDDKPSGELLEKLLAEK